MNLCRFYTFVTRKVSVLFIVIVVLKVNCGNSDCTVYWESSRHSTIGGTINLYCRSMGDSCSGAHKFIGGPNNEVLSLVRGVKDEHKYAVYLRESDGYYRLTVKSISPADLNVKYVCLQGFDKFDGVLKLKNYFNMTLHNKTLNQVCLHAKTILAYATMGLNRYWLWKQINSNSTYQIIKPGGRFIEERVDDGYVLCIVNFTLNDTDIQYRLNYYSSIFDIDLFKSDFVTEMDTKQDFDRKPLFLAVSVCSGLVLFSVLLCLICCIQNRNEKREKKKIEDILMENVT